MNKESSLLHTDERRQDYFIQVNKNKIYGRVNQGNFLANIGSSPQAITILGEKAMLVILSTHY